MIGILIFVAFSLVLIFMNFYSYSKFVVKISFLKRYKKIIKFLFVLMTICEFIFIFQLKIMPIDRISYVITASCLGIAWFLFVISLFHNILNLSIKNINFSPKRREFIKICFDITFVIIFVSYTLKGFFTALKPPVLKQTNIKIKGLKNPLKIAMISDIHIGEFLQKEFLEQVVNQINISKPDLVVIVGDLIDFSSDKIGDFLDPLKNLKSKYGTFYVPGNHEYYHGIVGILNKISELGIEILANTNTSLDDINLAGVLDVAGYRFGYLEPDLDKALQDIDNTKPTILLSHQPKFINYMKKNVDLVLCGHTHAGQIFPFSLLVLLDQPYLYGLYRHNDKMQVYVSSGAGFWGPPIRIFAPSEVAILNLYGE